METNTSGEIPKFIIVKDGNNQEHKVVNFDNPDMVKRTGTVIIRAIRKQSRHQPNSMFRCYRDRETGIIWGIPNGIDQFNKNLLFQSIAVNDIRSYDLSVMQDRQEYAVISKAPFLKGSPYAKGKPSHEIYDVQEEALRKIEKIDARLESDKIIKALSPLQILDMARNCGGIDTNNNSEIVIKAELYDFVEREPEKFMAIWNNTNRQILTVFNRCKVTGLISFDLNNGYLWKKATQLGTSEPMALAYMAKHQSLLLAMDMESKQLDKDFQASATEQEREPIVTAFNYNKKSDTKDVDDMMARLAEKEAKLDAILNRVIEPKESIVAAPKVSFVPEPVNSDLDKLRSDAKALGIKHTHLMGEEKLKEEIAKLQPAE